MYRSCGGLSANEKEEKVSSNDNKIFSSSKSKMETSGVTRLC